MRPHFPLHRLRFSIAVSLLALALVPAAHAAPVAGFVENWTSGLGDWSGGATRANPGTGGVDGAADGYLLWSRSSPAHLGIKADGTAYTGDWLAAGIKEIRFCLNDVNAANALEIHLSIGTFDNLWQYNPGFVPLSQAWSEFVVDLIDSTQFTHTIANNGAGFAAALQGVEVVHLRHDLAPFVKTPNDTAGDVGIDRFQLVGPLTPVDRSTWGRIKRLYR